jgi:hypothetical protein
VLKTALIDDSEETKQYYRELFANYKNKQILSMVTSILDAWSEVITTGVFSSEHQMLFESALRHSHEYVWYEAGTRLACLMEHDENAKAILLRVFADANWRSRFNVVAVSRASDAEFARRILSEAVNDRSARVREKAADIILVRQERHLLGLLEERLTIEESQHVIGAMGFALANFDRVRKDKNDSLSLHSDDIVR